MPDDNDGYLEITLDDDDGEGETGSVLDVTLEGEEAESPGGGPAAARTAAGSGGAAAPPRARRPASRLEAAPATEPEPSGEPGLPMTAGGVCARCGYALRPLEEVCPRCGQSAAEPVEKVPAEGPAAAEGPLPAPQLPAAPPQRRYCLFTLAGIIVFLALVIGVPLYIWTQPSQRARREYQAGLREQLRQDFEGARAHYSRALELDPRMALAAFAMGTTHLRIGSPGAAEEIQQITQQAMWGQTQALDEADRWFRQTLRIAQDLPPNVRLMDQRINSLPRLRAFAHMCLALTALVRYSAAIQAEQYEDALAWMAVASEQFQAASGAAGNDNAMRQILGNQPGLQPGTAPGGTPGGAPGSGAEVTPGVAPGFAPGTEPGSGSGGL